MEKLLFSMPERDTWRLDRVEGEALSMPFPRKLKWSVAIYCNPRGVRWNHQIKDIPKYNSLKTELDSCFNKRNGLQSSI